MVRGLSLFGLIDLKVTGVLHDVKEVLIVIEREMWVILGELPVRWVLLMLLEVLTVFFSFELLLSE